MVMACACFLYRPRLPLLTAAQEQMGVEDNLGTAFLPVHPTLDRCDPFPRFSCRRFSTNPVIC